MFLHVLTLWFMMVHQGGRRDRDLGARAEGAGGEAGHGEPGRGGREEAACGAAEGGRAVPEPEAEVPGEPVRVRRCCAGRQEGRLWGQAVDQLRVQELS